MVAQSSLSHQEERSQRELFWYREELFKCVTGRWHEVSLFFLDKSIPAIQLSRRVEHDRENSLSGLSE